jgi:hypothetical protein
LSRCTILRLLLLAVSPGACSNGGDDSPAPEAIFPADFAERFPEVRDCRLSPAEHDGFYIRVYASPDAAEAYTSGDYPFEPGVLLVKGEYDDDACTDLRRVSAMERLPDGEAPDLGDWRWQRTDADGQVLGDTPARSCAGCHSACDATDRACTEP